ncbi:hypothetical protein EYF80_020661 [Liparis tanakae]|uniref:Uncharacterized protein n=1 Tax=Liparis tanakae TaxID=230148 RepID=A0A4Z2HTJ3_9TELE|nr:hypothetical protein EYF80_020661 [Liparis tanakae]
MKCNAHKTAPLTAVDQQREPNKHIRRHNGRRRFGCHPTDGHLVPVQLFSAKRSPDHWVLRR